MGKATRIWTPPPCFAEASINATLPELAARYGVHHVTITKHILRLPEAVQAARGVVVYRRRCEASAKGGRSNSVTKATGATKREALVMAPRVRLEPFDIADLAIRDATIAFEAHYCHVADLRGWAIRGYAA